MPTPLTVTLAKDAFLDGDPADFPHREEAMAEYRALWMQFLMGTSDVHPLNPERRSPIDEAEKRMDELQSLISRGPGPVWKAFRATLPGYNEWWGGTYEDGVQLMKEKFGE